MKLNSDDFQASLTFMKNKFSEIFPNARFDYLVLEDFFNRQYVNEQKLGSMLWLFAGLTIFVACLGIWGLTAYSARQRTKEIGVRKVIGATIISIVWLLSKNSVKWILVSVLVSWPIAYLAMEKWLQNFAYRIDMSWWMFVLAGGIALLIALLTVSWQAIRAATANPVESLRYE
ncbi:MAG TPA: FtsX-like permease family protein [Caldithrix sp.]|nr:FtsX-like permease family protein [Caldithrix sp.]